MVFFPFQGILIYLDVFQKWCFPGGTRVKNLPAMHELQETQVRSMGQEAPPEEGIAIHSSNLAWRIPWTDEPGGVTKSRTRVK